MWMLPDGCTPLKIRFMGMLASDAGAPALTARGTPRGRRCSCGRSSGRSPAGEIASDAGEHRLQVGASRLGIADVELDGLPDTYRLGHAHGTALAIEPGEVPDQEVTALERRLRGIDR